MATPRSPAEVIKSANTSLRIFSRSGMLHHYPEDLIREMRDLIVQAYPQREKSPAEQECS